jgi:very-short-patch-repair endonuclease
MESAAMKSPIIPHSPPVGEGGLLALLSAPAERGRGTGRSPVEGVSSTVMRAPTKTINNARRLRRILSVPETRLWNRLRERAPGKPVFRRQHPIGPYVPDFYCAKARLAIEIDGISHDMGGRPQYDIRRDAWLGARGVTVVHIAAKELTPSIDEVADAIARMAAQLL